LLLNMVWSEPEDIVLGMALSEEVAPFVLLAFFVLTCLTWMGAVQFDNEGSLRRAWDSGVGV